MLSKIFIALIVGTAIMCGTGCGTQTEKPTAAPLTTVPTVPFEAQETIEEQQQEVTWLDELLKRADADLGMGMMGMGMGGGIGGRGEHSFLNLLQYVDRTDKEKIDELLDKATEQFLATEWPIGIPKSGVSYRQRALHELFSTYIEYDSVDRVLNFVYANWEELGPTDYYEVAVMLLDDTLSPEFRAEDFKKLFDKIEHPQLKLQLLDKAENTKMRFHWPPPFEDVLVIPDPKIRHALCRLLVIANSEQKTGVDVLPLLDAIAEYAEANRSPYGKWSLGHEVLFLAQHYSLWDEEKTADWLGQYETFVDQIQNEVRLTNILAILDIVDDETIQNVWFDKALTVARERFVDHRLDAYLQTANQAVKCNLLDCAHEIIDEALDFAATLTKRTRDSTTTSRRIRELEHLRDELQNK